MQPYNYQIPIVEIVVKALLETGRALKVLATGVGKTPIAGFVAKEINPEKILFLCDQEEILRQSDRKFFHKIFPNKSRSYFFGGTLDLSGEIVFATFQSMRNHFSSIDKKIFDMIIVDESHHSKAETYEQTLIYFQPKYLLGMTATEERMDEEKIEDIFGEPVINIGLQQAIENKWLTPFRYQVMSDGLNSEIISQITKEIANGEIYTKQSINEKLFIAGHDKVVARKIIAENKKAIIFCKNIKHADRMSKIIPNSGAFHSDNKDKTILSDFRSGKIQYIISVDMLNEGVDIPDVEMIVFLRSTSSKTIFLQQLGRALRLSKEITEILVMDFVGNLERISLLQEIFHLDSFENINEKKLFLNLLPEDEFVEPEFVTGDGFNFIFDKDILNMIDIFLKVKKNFYDTWQEASKAAIALGITNTEEYKERYKEDVLLTANPVTFYEDYPGMDIFLDLYYATWQEASKAAIALEIGSYIEYTERYKEDSKLPSAPTRYYKNCPKLNVFLGQIGFYETWQEASKAAIALGAASGSSYSSLYKQDPKLNSNPAEHYSDFPGWYVFLGKEEPIEKYSTWQEASKAAIALGVTKYKEYKKRYKEDVRLPSTPINAYEDFPGDTVFYGGEKKDYYSTWQEASKAAIALGVNAISDYQEKYSKDARLFSNPNREYEDFPGWYIFLEKEEPIEKYSTWQEASKAAIALGIKTGMEYKDRWKEDPRLPSQVWSYYTFSKKGFPGWDTFLDVQKPQKYSTWQEASKAAIALGIKTSREYKKRYSEDPCLFASPNISHKDFPEWKVFLGKENKNN